MAICSLVIDIVVSKLHEGHVSFYRHFRSDPIWAVSFAVWTFYTVVLTCASALCAHYIAPQAIGIVVVLFVNKLVSRNSRVGGPGM
ncbi:unnamed protein product [Nippostrongylus brasiliensis]|uniref:Golgi apparatus membrane protein TVP23 n=1 Tax=Nippostrongylus brasiliensis TaxID=27835 RepID=A0A0N4YTZ9_NIPBR|nr:unnamed protein product [Nippostrongylus brasiliensis]